MSELSKIIWSKIDQVPALGMYSLLLLVNALSFNQNILMLQKQYLTQRINHGNR